MRTLMIAAALAFLASAPIAHAQKIDKNGRCHAANGQFAKMEVCKGGAASGAAYKVDAKGKCHSADGKFAKADKCK